MLVVIILIVIVALCNSNDNAFAKSSVEDDGIAIKEMIPGPTIADIPNDIVGLIGISPGPVHVAADQYDTKPAASPENIGSINALLNVSFNGDDTNINGPAFKAYE